MKSYFLDVNNYSIIQSILLFALSENIVLKLKQLMHFFLSVVVFMGSEKYPEENEFDSFIRKHGGDNNAYTECEWVSVYNRV